MWFHVAFVWRRTCCTVLSDISSVCVSIVCSSTNWHQTMALKDKWACYEACILSLERENWVNTAQQWAVAVRAVTIPSRNNEDKNSISVYLETCQSRFMLLLQMQTHVAALQRLVEYLCHHFWQMGFTFVKSQWRLWRRENTQTTRRQQSCWIKSHTYTWRIRHKLALKP